MGCPLKCGEKTGTWLSLLRLPNLLTVPGDPLAGALLTAFSAQRCPDWIALLPVCAATVFLYAAGLLSNDYFDRNEDARLRPERPIPSGRITPAGVLLVAIVLTFSGIAAAVAASPRAGAVLALLAASIWGYNAAAKRNAVAGPLAMGLCRGLSLLSGAACQLPAAPLSLLPWPAMAGLACIVASITLISRQETISSRRLGFRIALPPAAVFLTVVSPLLLAWRGSVHGLHPAVTGLGYLAAGMAVVWSATWCGLIAGRPPAALIQKSVGAQIRGLILVQTALCSTAGAEGRIAALALLAAFMLSTWAGKWFSGS